MSDVPCSATHPSPGVFLTSSFLCHGMFHCDVLSSSASTAWSHCLGPNWPLGTANDSANAQEAPWATEHTTCVEAELHVWRRTEVCFSPAERASLDMRCVPRLCPDRSLFYSFWCRLEHIDLKKWTICLQYACSHGDLYSCAVNSCLAFGFFPLFSIRCWSPSRWTAGLTCDYPTRRITRTTGFKGPPAVHSDIMDSTLAFKPALIDWCFDWVSRFSGIQLSKWMINI